MPEQLSRIAFTPVRETTSTAPVRADYREVSANDKAMLPAFEENQTAEANDTDVVVASVPSVLPSLAITLPDLHSEVAPHGQPVWLLATVALVVAALVVSGFAMISVLRIGQDPPVAGFAAKREPVSSPPAIAVAPPALPGTARQSVVAPPTDPSAADAGRPVALPEAKPVLRRLTNTAPPVTGSVRLAIKPWGHVVVDGVTVGVTPPLKRLSLPPGQHKVQIVNPGFETYLTRIEIRQDDAVTVAYEFK